MERIIEVRAGEGGTDAKLFAQDLANAYVRLAVTQDWTSECL